MIIVLRPDATTEQIERIVNKLTDLEMKTFVTSGIERTIIGVIGDDRKLSMCPIEAIPGVEKIMPILKPFKMASRDFRAQRTIIKVGDVVIGDNQIVLIAGPCSVESREQIIETAKAVKAAGASMLRGGAYKPRTSPYAFQGLGEEGLKYLAEARDVTGLPVVTELMDTKDTELVAEYADIIQIGARNMQNFSLLKAVGCVSKPILLKRGHAATINEWLMSAEYIMHAGNQQVILCERGIRTFETATRNTLDLSAVPVVKELSHLPIIVDPSHGGGKRSLVAPLSKAAVACGTDGLAIEVHLNPEEALSDGEQSLLPQDFEVLVRELKIVAKAVGRRI
ncbi:3-deoxy-7-phosphoheptulonate synthase [Candidatus Desantisbacteria bacterium CG2_30_40_21]|uniref:3-deoxy-7-phosphoheptulonate synthase n=5 Tax=unclassified Candidatus Desantisiibacteriota TaxID=3106372 RepID=A0A2M7JCQ5_9BACT|nr:MAG: 3-deoxy-7-phosphoheptulonate synthase [Candidatus Desantisbacteria bacterium CG2_30_40_21]PIP39723.1 MAG: 3-deoxy-7-phosphoheptulonate synthase [Candidatus Desantisbacteria bacterium CG23_combo_of_CG06-09_8_20_14_all_40_23]PIX17157.1 MAG: 3-deoxy-7-phosphoheptulonate synthase [Candidatus Desantisbacteria bacterium CG_4_8_14_3_um_filter_40_12]PIY20114.1 MAG: 3-deoxy-7-phosphoheptulonate synthase [Candidatus Desantisbacteria bacterium CG_4_10_14_3_um_filter_40_18]PJB28133.1 MAG: 3-deoxy-7